MSSDYFVLRLQSVNNRAEEWLSQEAFASGALGMSEVLNFSQPEGEEDVFAKIPNERTLDVYFEKTPPHAFVQRMQSLFPGITARITGEENKDWLAEWKKGFKPFALTNNHWVVPSWCETPADARFSIRIDPGMAFGTGTHETTKLVARELDALGPHESLLDVGTGTGILAILGAQMGFKKVTATEIEEDSRRVAHENFLLNNVRVTLDERQVEDLKDKYSVVVANIIDGVLVRIQDALKARVKPGGWLIVSGIIQEREKDFLEGFKLKPNQKWRSRRQNGDWILYAVQL